MDPIPCTTTDQLHAWTPPPEMPEIEELEEEHDAWMKASTHRQLLVCHERIGDFPDCDSWEGCIVARCPHFIITHWLHMDTFCYFGHKMVTIPPPAYTSLAHKHGVKVMGTLIFEGGQGLHNLTEILATPTSMQRSLAQLLLIMQTWCFDGWMVKVAVELSVAQVRMLLTFLGKLLREAQNYNNAARVLWYDALCRDGRVVSQNRVCAANSIFYTQCDGIFINHAWTQNDLQECVRLSNGWETLYMGIDVWGRSGGHSGWNTHVAMSTVLNKDLSVGLFAPGWAVEENRQADPRVNSLRFWRSISDELFTRPLDRFPFKTNFCNGYSGGGRLFRMRDMGIMPALAHALSNNALEPTEEGLMIHTAGMHLLWMVKGIESNRTLRVKIRVQGPGTVTIRLDNREMRQCGNRLICPIDPDETIELRPKDDVCYQIRRIFLVASEPKTVLTYFEASPVETARCLEN